MLVYKGLEVERETGIEPATFSLGSKFSHFRNSLQTMPPRPYTI